MQQAVGLGTSRRVERHLLQDVDGLGLQGGQLVDQRGVEEDVGILLEGEDPLLLASAHGLPAEQGTLARHATGGIVAAQAADEAVLAGGDSGLVVDAQGGEGRGIDEVFLFGRNILVEDWVERMDALHDDHILGAELNHATLIFAFAGVEVVGWHRDFVARKEAAHVLAKLLQVNGIE